MKKREPATLEQKIQIAKYPIIMAPFFGSRIPVQVRELTYAQIKACGDFSLITTEAGRHKVATGNFKLRDIIQYSEMHNKILKAALVCPTYEQVFTALQAKEKPAEIEKQIEEINELINKIPAGPKRQELEKQRDLLRVQYDLIIPDNFAGFIVAYALGIDKSDIKKVSEEMLLESAYLAKRGNNNPADHLKGNFNDFMVEDINIHAWEVYDKKMEELNSATRG